MRIPWQTSWIINQSWFAIEEKCTNAIGQVVLIPLGLTIAALPAYAGVLKKS